MNQGLHAGLLSTQHIHTAAAGEIPLVSGRSSGGTRYQWQIGSEKRFCLSFRGSPLSGKE